MLDDLRKEIFFELFIMTVGAEKACIYLGDQNIGYSIGSVVGVNDDSIFKDLFKITILGVTASVRTRRPWVLLCV